MATADLTKRSPWVSCLGLVSAQQADVSANLIPSVVKAAETGGKTVESGLMSQFANMGITFKDMYTTASVNGMVQAINTVSYFLLGLSIILFIVAITMLPDTAGRVSTKKLT